MTCTNCQSDNPAENAFCGSCGTVLSFGDDAIPSYRSRSSSIKREAAIILVGIASILAALGLAYFLFFIPRSPDYAVRKFIEADMAGNFTDQSKYVSTRWDSRLFLSTFQTIRQASGASPFKGYHVLLTSERGETATVDVAVPLPNPLPGKPAPIKPTPGVMPNNTINISFQLVREGSEWRIDPAMTMGSLAGVLLALGINQAPGNIPFPFPFPGGTGGIFPPPATAPAPSAPQPGTGI